MYPICFGDVCIWMVIISVTVSAARMLSSGSYKLLKCPTYDSIAIPGDSSNSKKQ